MQKEFVINWHITEACNYSCRFCFAHWENRNRIDLIKSQQESFELIKQLKSAFDQYLSPEWGFDTLRINFAGGEPLLYAEQLAAIAEYCQSLGINTSLITNGVYLLEKSFSLEHFNMIGISIDSLDADINLEIGRHNRKKALLDVSALQTYLRQQKEIYPQLDIKVNTVVNSANKTEDMSSFITAVSPSKWKIFKMLPVLTDELSISDQDFQQYLIRHNALKEVIVSEDNSEMTASYLMIDPVGRFYSNAGALESQQYQYSTPILQKGVMPALGEIEFDLVKFSARY